MSERVTAESLAAAEDAARAAWERYDQLRQARNDTIRQAVAEGWKYHEVRDVTELSIGRIGQIVAAP